MGQKQTVHRRVTIVSDDKVTTYTTARPSGCVVPFVMRKGKMVPKTRRHANSCRSTRVYYKVKTKTRRRRRHSR
jgi:hypothetical protein